MGIYLDREYNGPTNTYMMNNVETVSKVLIMKIVVPGYEADLWTPEEPNVEWTQCMKPGLFQWPHLQIQTQSSPRWLTLVIVDHLDSLKYIFIDIQSNYKTDK